MLDLKQETEPLLPFHSARRRRGFAWLVSALVHGAALVALLWRPALFVKPRLVAHGEDGTATPVSIAVYLPQAMQLTPPVQAPLSLRSPRQPQKTQRARLRKRSNDLQNESPPERLEAGAREGSAFDGVADGEEVKPALPLPGSFADPIVSRWELPGGRPGDVVVEITIDAEGHVVEERLLQGMGRGIDDKVIAALRDWRFRPATRNGVPIPSKHDVHFHFPS